MKLKIIAMTAAVFMPLAPCVSAPVLAQTSSTLPTTGPYWACDPGFTLQVSVNAARCIKAGTRTETNPGLCAPPSQKRLDYRGLVDACVAGPIAGDMVCLDPTTRIKHQKGRDVCVKTTEPVIRQPSARVNRTAG
jgi:hypothetical protein